MKETGMVKKIDELGRIVVPKDIRNKLGVKNLDRVEFFIEGDSVILKKYGKYCAFCGVEGECLCTVDAGKVDTALIEFKGKYICRACLKELKG